MSGKLEKLVIISFRDKNFTDEVKDSKFTAPINPESFTKNFKVERDSRAAHGSSGRDPRFTSTGPQDLKLDFILDGTGTMEGYVEVENKKKGPENNEPYLSVHEQLEAFLKCVYDYDGDIHSPRYLIVYWGSEIKFPCVLTNLDINHTLFDTKGFPIRVRLSATFMGYITPQSQAALKRINSPDLTHQRNIKLGDRLDLMTYRIYNNPRFLLQVAKANGLSTIRQLTPGKDIYFPPFDKKEA
jgi:hypothetical protein